MGKLPQMGKMDHIKILESIFIASLYALQDAALLGKRTSLSRGKKARPKTNIYVKVFEQNDRAF